MTLTEMEGQRPDLVIHARLVSPLVMAAYARERVGTGTALMDVPMVPIDSDLTRDYPAPSYPYREPPTPDLAAAWRVFHAASDTDKWVRFRSDLPVSLLITPRIHPTTPRRRAKPKPASCGDF